MNRRSSGTGVLRSVEELAETTGQIARLVSADRVLCGTESGALFLRLHAIADDLDVVPATFNPDTRRSLEEKGFDVVRLSIHGLTKYQQAQHVVAMALGAGRVSPGDVVVVTLGNALERRGDLIIITDVDAATAEITTSEMIRLTDGIRPRVLEVTLRLACQIGNVARRGARLGAILLLGDSDRVLEGSRQLVPNPFQGLAEQERMLTDAKVQEMIVELAKLDGAFVLRGDGFIRTAGTYVTAPETDVEIPEGLGARHAAAAQVTAHSDATAVVVSATDGYVRVFAGGRLEMRVDPTGPLPSLPTDEEGGPE